MRRAPWVLYNIMVIEALNVKYYTSAGRRRVLALRRYSMSAQREIHGVRSTAGSNSKHVTRRKRKCENTNPRKQKSNNWACSHRDNQKTDTCAPLEQPQISSRQPLRVRGTPEQRRSLADLRARSISLIESQHRHPPRSRPVDQSLDKLLVYPRYMT